jgi:flagellar hook-basal body complex protein FliE
MAMDGLAGVSSVAGSASAGAGSSAAVSKSTTPFEGMFRSMVEQTSVLDQKASDTVAGLLSGQGVDIHEAMIATQKANIAFELALQVRNKAVAAYQQMMGMQF